MDRGLKEECLNVEGFSESGFEYGPGFVGVPGIEYESGCEMIETNRPIFQYRILKYSI